MEAVELRRLGWSTPRIAERLGVSKSTAWSYIRDAMAARAEEIAEHGDVLRAEYVEKAEEALGMLRERMLDGDPAAHRAALGWHQRLAKLQGLDLQLDAPAGPQVIVVDASRPWERGEVIDGDAAGLVEDAPVLESGLPHQDQNQDQEDT